MCLFLFYFLEFCEVLGGRYKVGKYFESKDCSGYCRCDGPTSFSCVSLCPPHGIYCIPGTRKVRTVKPAFTGSNCTCPSWKCVKGKFCNINFMRDIPILYQLCHNKDTCNPILKH